MARNGPADRRASTLGEAVIAGLISNSMALVIHGGVIVGLLAVLIYDGFLAGEQVPLQRTCLAPAGRA